ncbi:MAG: MBL fold metallo-hydrolase [Pseudomonadota bacterium]|nr:MBL fold metallo-hydrolase [Pseudomonadota bacterium]
MKIDSLVVGSFECNCFILSDEKTNEAIIIDPGDEPNEILSLVHAKGLKVLGLLHTHAHLDHMMATKQIKLDTLATTYLHKEDLYLWTNLKMQADMFGFKVEEPPGVDKYLLDEMEIKFGDQKIKTIFTPGHTPGSCCFHVESDESILFSGDTLFKKSIGRTDLWGGDSGKISKSIKNRLYTLADETIVLCGHGSETLIGQEKRHNPFVKG